MLNVNHVINLIMEKNILILSAGRRVELLEIFKNLEKNSLIKIFTADSYPNFSCMQN